MSSFYIVNSVAKKLRIPFLETTIAAYLSSTGELVRLVSSASRLIETVEIIALAGGLADPSKAKNSRTNVCGEIDIFLPPIQNRRETKRNSQFKRRVKARPSGSRVDVCCRTAVPQRKGGTLRQGTAGAGSSSERTRGTGEGEGSAGTGDAQSHTESCRTCQETDTEKGPSLELGNRGGSAVAHSKDPNGEEDSVCVLEERGAAPVESEVRVVSSATPSLEGQNGEAERHSLLRCCLALSGDTDSSIDQSDSEDESEDVESTFTGNVSEETAELTVPH
ncbi:hypothetical protein AAFF_G00080970 [Aldrovandia affinis]|uniref:Uncharacterized protein n=1 Tax=Aldrovandia affinis TaxID=143900 RepID=A0AAD7T3N1_9TELE|nr:hypothetical protein AAFF_G00080970 [Aldrovandia affinis]